MVPLKNSTSPKPEPCPLRLLGSQLVSTQRTGIKGRSGVTYQQSDAFPLYRHFSPDGATGAATGRIGA
jgi:hypothetical protein